MLTFLKANIASLIASVTDFLVFICLKRGLGISVIPASIAGTICGGVLNFFIGKLWVFKPVEKKLGQQALRYLLVWSGNLILNAGGAYVAINIIGLEDWIGKIIVSIAVAVGYNYPLQKRFVFYNN